MPRVVACGGRNNAYERFRHAQATLGDGQVAILLVDSEERVVSGTGSWSHLKKRDRWSKPTGATDEHAHLMVQCVESWFLADKDGLERYFGRGFNRNALPSDEDIENVSKEAVLEGIKKATRRCSRPYRKGRHSFALLGELDPKMVAAASPHVRRLLAKLGSVPS